MPNLGTTELIIILVIVILIFGAGKLGSLGKELGRGVKDFKGAIKDVDEAKKDLEDIGTAKDDDSKES